MEYSNENSLTKELHVANVLMIFNFCNSFVNCVILNGSILQRLSIKKRERERER